MDNLPKLVKPYYTIEEAFHRLKLAGADLNKSEDILLLARDNLIELKLLCEEVVGLIPVDAAKMAFLNIPKDYSNPDLYSHFNGEEDFNDFITELNWSVFLFSRGDGHSFKCPAKVDGNQRILLFKPMDLLVRTKETAPEIRDSKWLSKDRASYENEFNAVVEEDGDLYYVCELVGKAPLEITKYVLNKNKCQFVGPDLPFRLDGTKIKKLINKKRYVLKKESIIDFEKVHLGINHQNSYKDRQSFLPYKPIQSRREKVLSELIKQHGEVQLVGLGRLGVWQELTVIDSGLFPFRDNAEDGTVKKFFTNQKLIAFKPGR